MDHGDGRLPVEMTGFVGRRRELAEIKRLCGESRLVTITGLGGVGKTRTALRAAAELRESFSGDVRWVDLSALQDGYLVGHAIASALPLTDQTTRPIIEVLCDYLADRRLLLVLDTCDHLVDDCGRLLKILLDQAPGLRVLATSRQPLGTAGERVFQVPVMAVADPDRTPSSALARQEAVTLFAARAAAADPRFSLTEANVRTVTELCRRLDGIPLAIELAAGWLPGMSLDDLSAALDDRFGLLVNGEAVTPRHQALRTAVGWSHELCTEAQRLLWSRLSVFAGDFDLPAAAYVCGDETLPADSVPRLAAELVDRSILLRDDTGERFRLLDTLREYGAGWLRALGESELIRHRHRDWYLRLAEQGERQWFGPGQADTFTRTRREHDNLRAALTFSLTTARGGQTGLYLAATLWFYWVGCGQLCEGRLWLDRAIAIAQEPTPTRSKALWVTGYIAVLQGDSTSAVRLLEECRTRAVSTGDTRALAYAVHRMACAALISDRHAEAAREFRRAIALYEAIDELNSNVIMARVELAMTIAFQGDLEGAVELCVRIRDICELHGEQWAKAYAVYVLAFAAWTRGDLTGATALACESLRINHTFHDLIGIVLPIELLALLRTARRRHRQAAVLQGAAHQIWRAVGPPLFGSAYFNAPHHQCAALLRENLGDQAYEEAFQDGMLLDLGRSVALALSSSEQPSAGVKGPADS